MSNVKRYDYKKMNDNPQRCPICGARTTVSEVYVLHSEPMQNVECTNLKCVLCGPVRKTKQGAINAWNKLRWERGDGLKVGHRDLVRLGQKE